MEKTQRIKKVFLRYLLIILAGLSLPLLYPLLKALNSGLLSVILPIFGNTYHLGEYILFNGNTIELIPACLAGSAFYLLFILIFSTGEIAIRKRLILLGFSFLTLFTLNFLRILFLIFFIGSPSFETLHFILWQIVSTLFVLGVWGISIKIFRIKGIPIYEDISFLIKLIKSAKKPKRKH